MTGSWGSPEGFRRNPRLNDETLSETSAKGGILKMGGVYLRQQIKK